MAAVVELTEEGTDTQAGGWVDLVCTECGNEFARFVRAGRRPPACCSKACYNRRRGQEVAPTSHNSGCGNCGRDLAQVVVGRDPLHPSRETDIACGQCGVLFGAPNRLGRAPRFCSGHCRTRAATVRAGLRRQMQRAVVPALAVAETDYCALALTSAQDVLSSRLTEIQVDHYRRLRSSIEDFDEGLTALGLSLRRGDRTAARGLLASASRDLTQVVAEMAGLRATL